MLKAIIAPQNNKNDTQTEASASMYKAAADVICLINTPLAAEFYTKAVYKDPELAQDAKVQLTLDLNRILKRSKSTPYIRTSIMPIYNVFFSEIRELKARINDLDSGQEASPFSSEYSLAQSAEKTGSLKEAARHYERFLNLTPGVDYDEEEHDGGVVYVTSKPYVTTYAAVHYKLANVYVRLGDLHRAILHYQKAKDILKE